MRRGASVIENEDPPFGRWWEKHISENVYLGTDTNEVARRFGELIPALFEPQFCDLSF